MVVCISRGEPANDLSNLFGNDPGLNQIDRDLVIDEVSRYHMPQRLIGGGLGGFVDDLELVTQLGYGAGGVDNAQYLFPEAPTHRQQRVIGNHDFFIVTMVLDLGAAQLPGDLTQVALHDLLKMRTGRGLLTQDDLADN